MTVTLPLNSVLSLSGYSFLQLMFILLHICCIALIANYFRFSLVADFFQFAFLWLLEQI
jgi:hypothetical protein